MSDKQQTQAVDKNLLDALSRYGRGSRKDVGSISTPVAPGAPSKARIEELKRKQASLGEMEMPAGATTVPLEPYVNPDTGQSNAVPFVSASASDMGKDLEFGLRLIHEQLDHLPRNEQRAEAVTPGHDTSIRNSNGTVETAPVPLQETSPAAAPAAAPHILTESQVVMFYEGATKQVHGGDVFEDHAGCLSKVKGFETGGWVILETPKMGFMKVTDEYMDQCRLVKRVPI